MTLRSLAPFLCAALVAQTPSRVNEGELRAHLAFLADELLEGRGTGQRGGELAVRYLETQLALSGVQPLGTDGYRQALHLEGLRLVTGSSHLAVQGPEGRLELDLQRDIACGSGLAQARVPVDAPLVFVGHGLRAPEEGRDDLAGLDPRGKILVFLVGDRPHTLERSPCCGPENFRGRWTYKLELARSLGAAGALLIHSDASASYGWAVAEAGWVGERFQLAQGRPGLSLQGWLRGDAARRLFRAAHLDLAQLTEAAGKPGFKAVDLKLRLSGSLGLKTRKLVQHNVVGLIPGTHPERKQEAVVLSAHWDHLGRNESTGEIMPGAVDNGTGCAALLALARHLAQHPLERSTVILFPCAEEIGMLGSQGYVDAPRWPLEQTVAQLNLESLNPWGRTRDIGISGLGLSGLDPWARRAAQATGLELAPERPDPQGLFFRTDHFPFVRAGIPAISPGFTLDGGWTYLDPLQAAGAQGFLKKAYHRTTDRFDPTWDLRGLAQQTDFLLALAEALGRGAQQPPRTPKAPWIGAFGR